MASPVGSVRGKTKPVATTRTPQKVTLAAYHPNVTLGVSSSAKSVQTNNKLTYTIVEHDGGWAYKLGDVFSEAFSTHDEALSAAHQVVKYQKRGGETTDISWEDDRGHWHDEVSQGKDRPEAEVQG